jgi:hydrogenase assembly chaperone HypC/HupF
VSSGYDAPQGQAPHCGPDGECITCGDVALPMRVMRLDHARELALCADESGRRETVEIALVQPVEVGDELLVHAGTAISRLSAEEPSEKELRREGLSEGAIPA